MIVFELCCENDHTFEGWFPSKESFDTQLNNNLVSCPICNSTNLKKIPTAHISRRGIKENIRPVLSQEPSCFSQQNNMNYLKVVEKVYDFIMKNTEDVGENFTEEALKMHYKLVPHRNIRGFATEAQEKLLREEGIDFLKIPVINNKNKKETIN